MIRVYLAVAALLAVLATSLYIVHLRGSRDAIRAEYGTFVAKVRTDGEAAQKAAKAKESADRKRKDQADAENKRLRSTNAALARSLRDARSAGGYVPKPAPGAASPDRACFDRAGLERAIRQLDEGVSRLIEQGDQAVTDLDTAKEWAR